MNTIAWEAQTAAVPVADQRAYRMSSIDILRGLVIVIMALDHVRDFVMIASVQEPTTDPSSGPLLFVTRYRLPRYRKLLYREYPRYASRNYGLHTDCASAPAYRTISITYIQLQIDSGEGVCATGRKGIARRSMLGGGLFH